MTMHGWGQRISIGEARDECQQSNPIHAGNYEVSRLAGVDPGNRYAWSWWYNKQYLRPIQEIQMAVVSQYCDRHNEFYINLRDGSTRQGNTWGDHNPHLDYVDVSPLPTFPQYRAASARLVHVDGNPRVTIIIMEQPSPGNDWTIRLMWDDESGQRGDGFLAGNLPSDGSNQNGATSRGCGVVVTAYR